MFSEALQHFQDLLISTNFLSLWLKKVRLLILFVSGTPTITLDKLTRNENYQSWADSVDLWFIGNGCEDHLTTADKSIPEDKRT